MSENEQKPATKVIRASSGGTRLTAGGPSTSSSGQSSGQDPKTGGGTNKDSAGAKTGTKPSGAQTTPTTGSGPKPTTDSAPTKAQPRVSGDRPTARTGSGPSAPAAPTSAPSAGSAKQGSAPQSASAKAKLGGAADVMNNAVRATSGGVKMGLGKTAQKKGPRTVKLQVSSVDPWSVAKMAALMSLAICIVTVVGSIVVWLVLQATGVLGEVQTTLGEIAGTESAEELLGFVSLGNVFFVSLVVGVINMVLMTALATLFAVLYNIGSAIVGGLHLTLTDD